MVPVRVGSDDVDERARFGTEKLQRPIRCGRLVLVHQSGQPLYLRDGHLQALAGLLP